MLSSTKRNSSSVLLGFTYPKLHEGKTWFVDFFALDPATGSDFCQKVLSRGNTGDLMQMFTDFTGMAQPDASGLLKARGLGD